MNAERLIFNSVFPIWPTVAVVVVLLSFFVYKEIQRARQFTGLRVLLQVIAMLSLLGLVIRPSYKGEPKSESIILLTKGYNKSVADSLSKKFSLDIVRTNEAETYPDAKVISSWHQLGAYANNLNYVLGEGVPAHALDEFDNLQFDFIAGNLPQGISQLEPKQLKVNQENFLNGEVRSDQPEISLQLVGPGGLEDSIKLNGKGVFPFSLKVKPKQVGKFSYQIVTKANGAVINKEDLPLEVLPEKKLQILFIQQYPTFETRALKNYLSEKGHSVVIRYQVSKNTFRYEYANGEITSIPGISSALLSSFDLLVLSPEAFLGFNSGERQAIENSLKEGLGALLLFSQPPSKKLDLISGLQINSVKSDTMSFILPNGSEKITLPAVPVRVSGSTISHSIISDNNKNLVAGYFNYHSGKIGFQFLNETYRLSLEGKSNEYAKLWSPLIDGVARTKRDEFKITIASPFPFFKDQPMHVNVISAQGAPELFLDSIRIPMKEDVTLNNFWHGTVWVGQTGWHQFSLQDSTHLNFYVSADSAWSTLNLANQVNRNKTFENTIASAPANVLIYIPVSPLIFFLLLIFSSGILWLLAKL